MIFVPSCSIYVSSDLEPAESHVSTVLPVNSEVDIPRFVWNSTSCNILCSISKHAPQYAGGSFLHAHLAPRYIIPVKLGLGLQKACKHL